MKVEDIAAEKRKYQARGTNISRPENKRYLTNILVKIEFDSEYCWNYKDPSTNRILNNSA